MKAIANGQTFLVMRKRILPKLQAYRKMNKATDALASTKNVFKTNKIEIGICSKEATISKILAMNALKMITIYNLLPVPKFCLFRITDRIRKNRMIRAATSKYKLNPIANIV